MTYGMKIKLDRTRRGMHQSDYATACGISRQTLYYAESKSVASDETKRKIEEAMEVSDDEREK